MRYIFVAIIVFLIGLGLFLYGGIGYQLWKNFQPVKISQQEKVTLQNKSFHAAVSPSVFSQDDMRTFRGVIVELKDGSFVVKDKDGKKVKVEISDSTKFIGGDGSDLIVDKDVAASGKTDKKGVITAVVIQVDSKIFGKPFMK